MDSDICPPNSPTKIIRSPTRSSRTQIAMAIGTKQYQAAGSTRSGHLLLETPHLRTATVDALSSWIMQHSASHMESAKALHAELLELGAKPTSDEW